MNPTLGFDGPKLPQIIKAHVLRIGFCHKTWRGNTSIAAALMDNN
jgi:hypothetical protein